jgi:hypothetical protein
MPVKQGTYSFKMQMILSVIPFVNLWAAYRIEKLRLCLAIQLFFGLLGGCGIMLKHQDYLK